MRYILETIPHKNQRYPTVGDYWTEKDETEHIVVSEMKNKDYEFLVMIHELVEQYLCKSYGVKEKDITKFDINFEKNREEGNTNEPGDDNYAPYRDAHCVATGIERMMCGLLAVSWKDYGEKINSL